MKSEPPPSLPPVGGPRYRPAEPRRPRRRPYPRVLLGLTGMLGVLMGVLLWQVVGTGGAQTTTVTHTVHVKGRAVASKQQAARQAPAASATPAPTSTAPSSPSNSSTTGDGQSANDLQLPATDSSSGTIVCDKQPDGTQTNCREQGN